METEQTSVQFVLLEEDETIQIKKNTKRRNYIKLALFIFLVIIVVASIIGVLIYFKVINPTQNNPTTTQEYRWDNELLQDEFESYSDEYKKSVFEQWKKDIGREYETNEEHQTRYNLWHESWRVIANTNTKNKTFRLRMNQFGDLTQNEFKKYYLGNINGPNTDSLETFTYSESNGPRRRLQSSYDWTQYNTPVKNQGNCGSCWSFATTGIIECNTAIYYGTIAVSLSEQELIDCSGTDTQYQNIGCNGGYPNQALLYAQNNNGLCTDSEYPYIEATAGNKTIMETCTSWQCSHSQPITAYSITVNDENALETAVSWGCVSVSIEADQTEFQYYSSGILTSDCGTSLDHAVLLVGYGVDNGMEYWKVKNSWDTSWGEDGYIRLCKNCGQNGNAGQCGIASQPYTVAYS